MASQLLQPTGNILNVNMNSSERLTDTRKVVIPIHVLYNLLTHYHDKSNPILPGDNDERLFNTGYYDDPITLEDKA